MVLEAIRECDLGIWHYSLGSSRSLNDINGLDHSTTIGAILAGKFPPDLKFNVDCVEYCLLYDHADCIYQNGGCL